MIQQTFSCPSVSPRLARGRAGAGWGSLSRTEVRLVGRGNCSEEHCGSLRARTRAHRLSRAFHVLEALLTPCWCHPETKGYCSGNRAARLQNASCCRQSCWKHFHLPVQTHPKPLHPFEQCTVQLIQKTTKGSLPPLTSLQQLHNLGRSMLGKWREKNWVLFVCFKNKWCN